MRFLTQPTCLALHLSVCVYVGIMHKISPLVGPLRATPPIIGSEEERARREYTVQMSKRGLIDLCQQEASKFLVQGRYDLAVPGAIQVINALQEIPSPVRYCCLQVK